MMSSLEELCLTLNCFPGLSDEDRYTYYIKWFSCDEDAKEVLNRVEFITLYQQTIPKRRLTLAINNRIIL